MSKKKKKNRFQQNPVNAPQIPLTPMPPALPETGNFDSMEAKILGEEIMMKEDLKKAKEVTDLKKKLDKTEVDRRLEELRRQLGLKR